MAKIDLTEYLEKLEEPEDRETVANREYQQQLFLEYVVRGDNFPEQRAALADPPPFTGSCTGYGGRAC